MDYPTDPRLPPAAFPAPYSPQVYSQAGPYPYGPYPGYETYRQKPPGTNGNAIAALIIALGGLILCCGIPSVIGLPLGIVAMRQTRRTGQDGWGLALSGAIIGGLSTVVWVFIALFWVGIIASGFSLV